MHSLKVKAPAKINLFLEVTGERKDGYHNLAALFARISLFDELSLKKVLRPGISLKVANRADFVLPEPEENIVYKAARKFFETFGIQPSVEIRLLKRIPAGAGLGGGSSDAAAVLKALSRLYGVNTAQNLEKLRHLALELGSDVPFFLAGGAFAAGTGRGEILKPVSFRGRPPAIVLVYPGTPIYTRPVYRALRPVPSREKASNIKKIKALVEAIESGSPLENWGKLLFNRLEEPVLPAYKAVREARADLVTAGATAVLMSGSGASVFALVPSGAAARKISKTLKKPGRKVFLPDFLLKFY